ncbi:MAG: hypothetical protein KDC66_19250 [Phaeodactylibacter sp.]|nr:hypothetical protein [Phaeodactylibacter sp.]MCB9273798.1 hypothetical protein [Lewinellaceae bacterium]
MKKRLPFPLLLFLFSFLFLNAQRSSEAGIFIGASNYMGDLSPSPLAANETHLAFGGHYRYMAGPKLGLKGSVSFGKISGSDSNIPLEDPTQGARRWDMEAGLMEVALQAEWHFLGTPRYNNAGLYTRQASPFLSAGLGLAFAEAKITTADGDKVRFPEPDDKSAFIVLPLSAGVRFDITESILLAGEFGVRATFSDYLDGLSEYANPKHNDYYLFGGITILYLIDAEFAPAYRY